MEEYESTVWEVWNNKTDNGKLIPKDKAKERAEELEGLPLFAVQTSEKVYEFIVASWHGFYRRYITVPQKQKRYYEVIRHGEPLNFFVDLDVELKDNPRFEDILTVASAVEETKSLVVKTMVESFPSLHAAMVDPFITVLDSTGVSKDGPKISYHLIFRFPGFALKNMEVAKQLNDAIVRNTPDSSHCWVTRKGKKAHIIDPAVYTKDRLFRLWGSTKFGEQRYLRIGNSAGAEDIFELDLFCMSLIGYFPLLERAALQLLEMSNGNRGFKRLKKPANKEVEEIDRTLSNQVADKHPLIDIVAQLLPGKIYKVVPLDAGGTKVIFYILSKDCKIYRKTRGVPHSSNNITYWVDFRLMIMEQRCTDMDCAGQVGQVIKIPMEFYETIQNFLAGRSNEPVQEMAEEEERPAVRQRLLEDEHQDVQIMDQVVGSPPLASPVHVVPQPTGPSLVEDTIKTAFVRAYKDYQLEDIVSVSPTGNKKWSIVLKEEIECFYSHKVHPDLRVEISVKGMKFCCQRPKCKKKAKKTAMQLFSSEEHSSIFNSKKRMRAPTFPASNNNNARPPSGFKVWANPVVGDRPFLSGDIVDRCMKNPMAGSDIQVWFEQNAKDYFDLYFAFIQANSSIMRLNPPSGNPLIQTEPYELMSVENFLKLTSNTNIVLMIEQGDEYKAKEVNLGQLWYRHHRRRTYTKCEFLPGVKEEERPEVFNLFRGWPFELLPDDEQVDMSLIKAFLDHIYEVWCNSDKDVDGFSRYIVKWLSDMFKHPMAPCDTALILYSEEHGAGKDIITELILSLLLGPYWNFMKSVDDFNNRFTNRLVNKLFIKCNELGHKGGHKLMNQIKNKITERYQEWEKKFVDSMNIKSYTRYCFQTNWRFCMLIEQTDRRMVCVEVENHRVGDKKYFQKLLDIRDNPLALRHLFTYLMRFDAPEIDLRDVPFTDYKKIMQRVALRPVQRWLLDASEQVKETGEYIFKKPTIQVGADTEEAMPALLDIFKWTHRHNQTFVPLEVPRVVLYNDFKLWLAQERLKFYGSFVQEMCDAMKLKSEPLSRPFSVNSAKPEHAGGMPKMFFTLQEPQTVIDNIWKCARKQKERELANSNSDLTQSQELFNSVDSNSSQL